MATIQEIVDNALPGELVYVNNFGYKSLSAFVAYCAANSIPEVDDVQVFYRRTNAIGYGYIQRPFNPDITTRFDTGTLKSSTRSELRLSSGASLPPFFFDSETGLIYYKDEADTTTPDNGLTIVTVDGIRYKAKTEYVTPEMFYDGTGDWATALQSAFDQGVDVIANDATKVYPVSESLIIRGNVYIAGEILLMQDSGLGITIGDSDEYTKGITVQLAKVNRNGIPSQTRWDDETAINVLVLNVIESTITVGKSSYGYAGVVVRGVNNKGSQINDIYLGDITGNRYPLVLDYDNGGWSNDNLYYSGRYSDGGIVRTGDRAGISVRGRISTGARTTPNNNCFLKPVIEQSASANPGSECNAIHLDEGINNSFKDVRVDGSTTFVAKFTNSGGGASLCLDNVVELGYTNDFDISDQVLMTGNKGALNKVLYRDKKASQVLVFNSGYLVDRVAPYDDTTYNIRGVSMVASFGINVKNLSNFAIGTDYIEILGGRGMGINLDTSSHKRFSFNPNYVVGYGAMVGIKCFDAAGISIGDGATALVKSDGSNYWDAATAGGCYRIGTKTENKTIFQVDDSVKSVCVFVYKFTDNPSNVRIKSFQVYSLQHELLDSSSKGVSAWAGTGLLDSFNVATQAPTIGTHVKGKYILNDNPSELGSTPNKYVVDGWRCIVAGTPGTWVECRSLTGN